MPAAHHEPTPTRATSPRTIVTVMWHTQKNSQNKPISVPHENQQRKDESPAERRSPLPTAPHPVRSTRQSFHPGTARHVRQFAESSLTP